MVILCHVHACPPFLCMYVKEREWYVLMWYTCYTWLLLSCFCELSVWCFRCDKHFTFFTFTFTFTLHNISFLNQWHTCKEFKQIWDCCFQRIGNGLHQCMTDHMFALHNKCSEHESKKLSVFIIQTLLDIHLLLHTFYVVFFPHFFLALYFSTSFN